VKGLNCPEIGDRVEFEIPGLIDGEVHAVSAVEKRGACAIGREIPTHLPVFTHGYSSLPA
jgi:hypothetical protein